MKNLRLYEHDTDFKTMEQTAGGDGNSVKTKIPGVSSVWVENNTYYNPHDETKLLHTITINYKDNNGTTIAPSEVIDVSYYSGVTQEIILAPKTIEDYIPKDVKKTIVVPDENSMTFVYYDGKYTYEPLTFKVISAGTIVWKAQNTAYTTTIEYSKDNGETWTSTTSNTGTAAPSISVNVGDVIQFRGDNATYTVNAPYYNSFSGSTAKFEAEGNIMSLINSTNFATATTLVSSYTFYYLFNGCTGLTSAENLVFPATTLADSCYSNMFRGCISLTTAPSLPATTLTSYCYNSMFSGCTSLTSAPELPATTLAIYCYGNMFQGCTNLTTPPPSIGGSDTVMGISACTSMFSGCTSLTTAPELPATTLAVCCYESMFSGCTSLTTAPELPATILVRACYWAMFSNCTSLVVTPKLPAMNLGVGCYGMMFNNCTGLTTAPSILPATTLTERCYQYMFGDCTSLTTAPELPATTLADSCYYGMFYSCKNLNYIKCLATDIFATNCRRFWVTSVATSGTFVKNPNTSSWPRGQDGIPSNWTVQDA